MDVAHLAEVDMDLPGGNQAHFPIIDNGVAHLPIGQHLHLGNALHFPQLNEAGACDIMDWGRLAGAEAGESSYTDDFGHMLEGGSAQWSARGNAEAESSRRGAVSSFSAGLSPHLLPPFEIPNFNIGIPISESHQDAHQQALGYQQRNSCVKTSDSDEQSLGEDKFSQLVESSDEHSDIDLNSLPHHPLGKDNNADLLKEKLDQHIRTFLLALEVPDQLEVIRHASSPEEERPKSFTNRIDVHIAKALLDLRGYTTWVYNRQYDALMANISPAMHGMAAKLLRGSLEAFFVDKLKSMACRSWGLLHFKCPFPSVEVKKQLSLYSDRTGRQVSDWFTNWRARSWKKEFLKARKRLLRAMYTVYACVVLQRHFRDRRGLPNPGVDAATLPFALESAMDQG